LAPGDVAGGLDGRSLLDGEPAPLSAVAPSPALPERDGLLVARQGAERVGWAPLRALVRGRYKYIDAPRPELYDLRADPNERRNLLSAEPALARTLADDLEVAFARLAARRRALGAPSQSAVVPVLLREQLAALGYASPMGPSLSASGVSSTAPAAPVDPKDAVVAYERALASALAASASTRALTGSRSLLP
jgi:hypothetical protein